MKVLEHESIDMPSLHHSIVQSHLAALFYMNYREKYRALTQPTLLLDKWESEPDLAIYPKRPVDWRFDEIKLKDVPLTVIEIISPRQGTQEIKEKIQKYFDAGVNSCWLINPLIEIVQVYTPDWKKAVFSDSKIQDKTLDVEFDFKTVFA